eukprot:761756-Hanusia_phi.AAC.1
MGRYSPVDFSPNRDSSASTLKGMDTPTGSLTTRGTGQPTGRAKLPVSLEMSGRILKDVTSVKREGCCQETHGDVAYGAHSQRGHPGVAFW